MNDSMILILGVTASGKARLAFDLARDLNADILSIDSMKVYRRMNIGTAKPSQEARRRITHHLIDIVEPSDYFSVAAFLDAALDAIRRITAAEKPVVAVGGTALYIKALLYGLFQGPGADEQLRQNLRAQARTEGLNVLYDELTSIDPVAADRIDPYDERRIIRALEIYRLTGRPISSFQKQFAAQKPLHKWKMIGLRREREDASSRINSRTKKMIAEGLVDEVKSLLAEEKPLSKQAGSAIGYAEIIEHLAGRITLEDATELIKKNTRRLAKNQRTWFKTFSDVRWLDVTPEEPPEEIFTRAKAVLENMK
ncbi:MAG: tRNA (adenosine(37)-N6)-dimethylallyltransferase MiaA [Phycisphaerales bacterium]|nr:MAG: tRNA (adenosine(37)-N6)-dimethylallyltransferase MiaA [Phycisphaerales bacterium]